MMSNLWAMPIIIATIGGLLAAILFQRYMETWRKKKYIRESRINHQQVQQHPIRMESSSILVLFSDLEYPDYGAMEQSLLSHATHLGDEIALKVYRRKDDDGAQVLG